MMTRKEILKALVHEDTVNECEGFYEFSWLDDNRLIAVDQGASPDTVNDVLIVDLRYIEDMKPTTRAEVVDAFFDIKKRKLKRLERSFC
jgi:hypothetical protein